MHIMTTNQQLELGFNATQRRIHGRREQRAARANWWFATMREAVENALQWEEAMQPRPEQIKLAGINREVNV